MNGEPFFVRFGIKASTVRMTQVYLLCIQLYMSISISFAMRRVDFMFASNVYL